MDTTLTEDEIAYAGIDGQRALLRAGRLTAVELLELLLARTARLDPHLGCYRTLFASAHEQARAADVALAAGDDRPLLGIPVAVKDNLAVAGHAPSQGTASPEPVGTTDAEIARRLRAAGAVIVGATKLPELALWPFTESMTFGDTRNPWSLAHTPGGSSGGSAAAVAAGLVAAAHATDGGGSIRIPAACCGLVGLKPGVGFVSLKPDTEHWHGLSSAGCVTRTVADTVTMLNVLQDRELTVTDPGPLRIGWTFKAPLPTPVDPELRAALDRVVEVLKGLGHSTFPADPAYAGVQESFLVRYLVGAADDLAKLADPSVTEPRTRLVGAIGRRLAGRPLQRALRLGRTAAGRLADLPDGAQLLLMPTMAGPPAKVGSLQGRRTLALAGRQVPFTPAWNVTGQPAISVPAGMSREGTPLAVQLVGAPGSESLLLSVAAQLETALDWPATRPPIASWDR